MHNKSTIYCNMKKLKYFAGLVLIVICQGLAVSHGGQATKRQLGALQGLVSQFANFPYKSVGCFRDAIAKPRPFPEMIGNFRNVIDLTNPNKTVAKCAAKAYLGKFQYFGIEYMGECWSGEGANLTYNKFGPSSQCLNGLGGDDSFSVYRFNEPPKPLPSPSSLGCFPRHSTVQLQNGQRVTLAMLTIGQKVKTLDVNGDERFSEVVGFLHKSLSTPSFFVHLALQGGLQVTLTPEHLIYVAHDKTTSRAAVFARDVKVGDKLVTSEGRLALVQQITHVTEEGLFAPLTMDGTLFVDDILVSCYAHVRYHWLGHLVMAPVRLWRNLLSFSQNLVNNLPWVNNITQPGTINTVLSSYTNSLLTLTDVLPFKDSFLSV